jgi:hypothetical protein
MKEQDMRRTTIRTSVMLLSSLVVPLVVVAEETSSLLIDGPQGRAKVIQEQGKNYVELKDFARITGASLRFTAKEITLTFPEKDTVPPAGAVDASSTRRNFETISQRRH